MESGAFAAEMAPGGSSVEAITNITFGWQAQKCCLEANPRHLSKCGIPGWTSSIMDGFQPYL